MMDNETMISKSQKDIGNNCQQQNDNKITLFLDQARTILKDRSNSIFATWYDEKGKPVDEYTFERLWNEAGYIAHALRNKWNIKKGDLVVLCYDFGIHFFSAFIGCQRAGVTAVIVYPPSPPLVKSLAKMNSVIEDCSPTLILTDSKVNLFRKTDMSNPLSKSRHLWPSNLTFKVTTNISRSIHEQFDEPNISPSDLAFLQYTSGSTGNPKGVMVTQSALGANIQVLGDNQDIKFREEGIKSQDVIGFSWLPQYHDLGLIFFFITPFAKGWTMHLMSPISFIKNPLLWIDLMSQHKVHFSGGPDFSYQLAARKFKEAVTKSKSEPIQKLDLSSICYLINAAEPIRLDTKDNFVEAFGKYGLSKNWFTPSYGLAESVVGVSWLNSYHTDRESDSNGQQSKYEVVAIGEIATLHPSVTVKIVDPDTCIEIMKDGLSGEIWVGGPSVAAGYYGKPNLSKETFQAQICNLTNNNNSKEEGEENYNCLTSKDNCKGNQEYFLRTGDKGFLKDGRLFICGRYKDLIIINGVNYYPQDIENVAQAASPSTVRPGCCAAFASNDNGQGSNEELVVIFEIRTNKKAKEACLEVQSAISRQIGLIATVVAIKERTICKTTSGKIQRRQNRKYYNEGKLQIVYQIVRSQSKGKSESTDATGTNFEGQLIEDKEQEQPESLDTFLTSLFGHNINNTQTWANLEMTSMQSVELSNFVSKQEGIQLPPNFIDLYPTIGDLKEHIMANQGNPIDVALPDLICVDNKKISWNKLMALQLVGILFLLVMIAAPMIPAVYFARAVDWYFIPLVYPIWMLGYTVCTILAKWVVIGKYKEQQIAVPSHSFVRWWFVDRIIFIWNSWVGYFIQDSPLQWLAYVLMGAKIHPSSKIDTLLQEFDLVHIGSNAKITSPIRCSKFAYLTNQNKSDKVLQFRPITIQPNSDVDGHLSPGVVVGEQAVVETYAVVAEGGQIPENSIVCGNPACNFGIRTNIEPNEEPWRWQLDVLKVISYIVFLYLSFGCMGLGIFVVQDIVITNWEWQYAQLFLTFLSVFVGIVISTLLNVIMKWVLIGKRQPGPYKITLLSTFVDWFVDYHFKISSCFLGDLASNSRSWNLIMKLYGMNVDWMSNIVIYNFPPSKVDLISMKKSFSSAALYKVKKDGEYFKTVLNESSIGWNAHVAPGVEITRGILHPMAVAKQDVIRTEKDVRVKSLSLVQCIITWIVTDLVYLALFGMIAAASIPTFELCITYFHDLSSAMIIPVASLLIIIQSIMMLLVLNLFQLLTYAGCSTNKRTEPWSYPLLLVCVSANWSIQRFNLLPLTWGTPIFNLIAKFLGCSFLGEGHALFWGIGYDFPYITIENDTILDYPTLSGHHVVHHKIALGPVYVSGILHPMTYVMPNVTITEKESGPWVAPISSTTKIVPSTMTETVKNDKEEAES